MTKISECAFSHSEQLLQWAWEHLLFDISALRTTCGKAVFIQKEGSLNETDGPDFRQAAIEIDGVLWHGDIEIHTRSQFWKQHGHHTDPNFNSVILHIVAESAPEPVYCENGGSPFTLNLLPYMNRELARFLKHMGRPKSLPCASSLHYISETAFTQQIEKAHKEYFDKKANDFLKYYNPNILPSTAWKHALIISLFDGLGISHNRRPMRTLAARLLEELPDTFDGMQQQALQLSGLGDALTDITWNLKSVRPASHPRNRIRQAAALAHSVMEYSFPEFLRAEPAPFWKRLLKQSGISPTRHFDILFGTVFLPSLYVLGNLYASERLTDAAFSEWMELNTPIPKGLLSGFNTLPVQEQGYRKKLGAVHQLRNYCQSGKCTSCLVLKKAFQS